MASNELQARPNAASARKLYLTAYNIIFAALWFSTFITTISNAANGKVALFKATETQTRWIQTASLIEVLHAATGTSQNSSKMCLN